ncbi:MAG: SGNH/GDSL hydrolase family protein [bacterium]
MLRGTTRHRAGAVFLALLLSHAPPLASAGEAVDLAGLPGPAHVLELEGSLVHFGVERNPGAEYFRIDIGNPEAPRVLSAVELGATVTALLPLPDVIYVGVDDPAGELVALDATTLEVRGRIDLPGEAALIRIEVVYGFLVALRDPAQGGENIVVLTRDDIFAPVVKREASGKVSIGAVLVPAQLSAEAQPGELVDWQRHPTDAAITVAAYATTANPLRLLRGIEDRLRLRDHNGDGVIRLACVGDSNSVALGDIRPMSWCAALREEVWHRQFEVVNPSVVGAGLRSFHEPKRGAVLLERALSEEPDAVLLALGTNDLDYFHADDVAGDAADRVGKMKEFETKVLAAGAEFFVALVPPRYDGVDPAGALDAFNAEIRKTWPAEQILDFHSAMPRSLFRGDGLHFTGPGQAERARRAYAFLLAPQPAVLVK